MAEGKDNEELDLYYKKLEKEVFKGTYIGDFTRGDSTGKQWKKVKCDTRTFKKKMKGNLEQIRKFEGRVWKGIHEGIFYVNPDTTEPYLFTEGTKRKYKIERYNRFDFSDNSKTGDKYTSRCGYYFTLTAAD